MSEFVKVLMGIWLQQVDLPACQYPRDDQGLILEPLDFSMRLMVI